MTDGDWRLRIFISYASEQKNIAEPIAFSLRARGHTVFLDKDDLPAGRSYDDQIQKAVEQSDVMIYLVSPASVAKGRYTRTELEFARAVWRHPANRVLPVMIEPTPIVDIPSFLTGVTILEPHGNVTAEVAAAVERLRGSNVALAVAAKGAAIAAACAFAAWSIESAGFALKVQTPDLFWLSGLPFCAIIWLLGSRRSIWSFAPAATLVLTSYIALAVIGPIQLFESIDTTFLMLAEDSAANTDSDTTNADADNADADTVDERQTTLEKIDRMNERSKMLNHVAASALMGVIGLLGLFLGATWTTPEINTPGRWLVSVAAVGLAMSLAGMLWWALFYEPGFLGGLRSAMLTLYSWFPIAGGILGYWIGRGRPS